MSRSTPRTCTRPASCAPGAPSWLVRSVREPSPRSAASSLLGRRLGCIVSGAGSTPGSSDSDVSWFRGRSERRVCRFQARTNPRPASTICRWCHEVSVPSWPPCGRTVPSAVFARGQVSFGSEKTILRLSGNFPRSPQAGLKCGLPPAYGGLAGVGGKKTGRSAQGTAASGAA